MKTIPNSNPTIQTIVSLRTPCVALCPHSGEPQAGSTITIRYTPAAVLLELHAVEEWMKEQQEALDLETFTQRAARDAAAALGVPATVEAHYILRNGLEMIVCARS